MSLSIRKGAGSEPDYFPGKLAGGDLPKM